MVSVIHSTTELMTLRAAEKEAVAFVPTMGNLHAGHLSLLQMALRKYSVVYFSIFVNPKQFGPSEDFEKYPRTLESDVNLIREVFQNYPDTKIIIYSPTDPKEVFPEGENQVVSVTGLSTDLEGHLRPGHFDGVSTVVHRLFEIIRPTEAYFGLKDYQQYLVIKQMVKDLSLPVIVTGMPIIREESGLAMSSRNQYLTDEEKDGALILGRTLKEIEDLIDNKKAKLFEARTFISSVIHDKEWNYLEIRDSETFSPDISMSNNITIVAVYQIGTTRLLDNVQVEVQ